MENKALPPLSIDGAARLLAVSPRTISRLIDRGEIRAFRIGATLAVPFDGMSADLRRCFDTVEPRALLTLHEVAALLGCSPNDVRARTASGVLKPVRVGRSLRWSPAEVERSAGGEG